MKPPRTPLPPRRQPLSLAVGALGCLLSAASLPAAPFLYSPGDLVLAIRQVGGASELAVNLGPVTRFANLDAGSTLHLTNLSNAQLSVAFPSRSALRWSVAAANRPPALPTYPLQTLWVTAPRSDPDAPAAPWLRKGAFVQGNAGSQIDAVGGNAALASSLLPGGPDNTEIAVVLPASFPFALSPALGTEGNYVGTFQGSAESVTPDLFDAEPSLVSRADLFELLPGATAAGTLNTPGRLVGTFEFKPDGTLTFTTGATTPPPAPLIRAISRSPQASSLIVASVTGFQYRLRYTSAAGLHSPVSTWNIGPSAAGTGGDLILEHPVADTAQFYLVEVQP